MEDLSMLRHSVVALSLVGLLAGTGVAFAQDTQPKPAPTQRAHGMAHLQKRLGLTDDQAKAVTAAYAKHRDEQKQAWQALRVAQADLRKLALNGGDTTAKTAEVQQLLGQTVAVRVKVLQEIGPVLTPEQRVKFAEARPEHGMRHHHRKAPAQG
jgi:Spy/CpxP family protein refolding chaperone